MTIELPVELEQALKMSASSKGISPDVYLRGLLERELSAGEQPQAPRRPLKTGYGMLAKYGPAPSAEEIDENRRDMLRGSIFAADAE